MDVLRYSFEEVLSMSIDYITDQIIPKIQEQTTAYDVYLTKEFKKWNYFVTFTIYFDNFGKINDTFHILISQSVPNRDKQLISKPNVK